MEPIYQLNFEITELHADRFGRLKSSAILYFVQEAACRHWQHIEGQTGEHCDLFWVIIRHRVQVSALPRVGQKIRLETWPMPTTRVAYPRSVVAYDEAGQELVRSISLWVLMDPQTRAMVLPGKSGVIVPGILRGNELPSPNSLAPASLSAQIARTVRFTDLDAYFCQKQIPRMKIMDMSTFVRQDSLAIFLQIILGKHNHFHPTERCYLLTMNI